MRIALVILHADASRGGAERYTMDLAAALAARGEEVTLVASSSAGVPAKVREARVVVGTGGKVDQYREFLDGVDAEMARGEFDVAHAMLPVRRCDVYHPHAGLAAEAVATGHTKYPWGVKRALAAVANRVNRKRVMFARVERELMERPDGPVVLCLSEYVKEAVRRRYALPEARMATLFNAVDLRRFDPMREPLAGWELRERLEIPEERVVALMIAQDFARKGLREAIWALRELAEDEPVTLLVVGKGNTVLYERFARQARVSNRVIFAGATENPYPYYKAADLFVLPTRHDPCSLVVLEALAMGVPVISTVFNGACEIMTDGVHGRVLKDPLDVAALATAMRHLLDETTRRVAGEACMGLRPALSFDAHVDRLLSIYAGVVAARA